MPADDGSLRREDALEVADPLPHLRLLEPGPLPVTDDESTIAVRDGDDSGSVIDRRASFSPVGASEADAIAAVAGVVEGGLAAL